MNSFKEIDNNINFLLKKYFINCGIHGKTEALLNGKCIQCIIDKEKELEKIEELNTFRNKQIKSGIVNNSIYKDASFDNYYCKNEKQIVFKNTLNNYNYDSNLILSGNCGTGKTHLAIALINRAIKSNKKCYYVGFYEIAKMYVKNETLFEYLLNVDFLVIDEFGVQDTEFKSGLLFEILDKRAIINKATCLITNLSIEEFKGKVSIPIQSRLKVNCQVIQGLNWQDYRIYKNN